MSISTVPSTAPAAIAERSSPPATRRRIPRAPTRVRRLVLGPPDQPRWARPLLWTLLAVAAAVYLIGLTSSGYANEFYAAAVKSGTESWQAWLFGSLDSANAITVDKPPVSLWLMVLSARILGFSSFSLLLPQALLGIGTVALVHATVRRWAGPAAGLIAGALVVLTPVAALMFRFDNPDALLTFLMTLGAYAVVRAIDAGHAAVASGARRSRALRWMIICGAAIGFAFLTKMGQGLLVVPAFALAYLVASPLRLRLRLAHLLAALGSMIISAGWFVALVELWPAASRPYIGGSTTNSLWELALGYNGLGRLLGGSGGGGGGGGNTGFGGASGVLRLFQSAFGGEISWFLPAALIALVATLIMAGRRSRTARTRAGMILWGGWLLLTAGTFSLMSGTIHPYYAVALAPAIAAVVAIGATRLWAHRDRHVARITLAGMIAATAGWGWYVMLRDASGWMTWLAWTMLVGGMIGAIALAVSAGVLRRFAVAAVLVGVVSAGLGAGAFTVATVATGHHGSIPSAGPAVAANSTGGPGGGGGGRGGGTAPSGTQTQQGSTSSTSSASTDASALTTLLDQTTTRWSAAVIGDQSAAGYILSTDTAVMAVGGWSGSDDAPTLAQFQAYVVAGDISYFIASGDGAGGGRGGGSDSSASQITAWVEANFTATTVGGVTVYDLTT